MKPRFSFLVAAALLLCVAETPLAAADPPASDYFNVRRFGAVGDGLHLDSPAIDRAINTCARAGGGTVYLSAGTYLSGSIHLQSNIHLLLDAGATILGAPQAMNVYDETEPYSLGGYQDGGHCYFHNSLIWGENLTNVFITGNGTIDGGGLVRADQLLDRMCGFAHDGTPESSATNLPPVRLGNKAVALKLCRNVLLRDVTIIHGGHFAVLVTGCDNLTVDNVTMDTDRDGIDIDCCRNTTVSNCRINAPNDDALCPKSTYALGELRPTENLTIVNCQVSGFQEGTLLDGTLKPGVGHNGRIKFGTESSGGFRNCTVANCTFRSCRGLALEEVDGGIMENITINNLTMMDVPDYAIYVTTGRRNRTPGLRRAEMPGAPAQTSAGNGIEAAGRESTPAAQAGVTTPSRARNILISNVIADGVGRLGGIQIMGLPEQPVDGVRLDNIRLICRGGGTPDDAARRPRELGTTYPEPAMLGVLPAYGVYARHVRDLELANLRVSYLTNELRPAAMFSDVQGLEIDNFKPQVAAGVPAAVFGDNVSYTVRNSPALPKAKSE